MNFVCTPHPGAMAASPITMSSNQEDETEVITVSSSGSPEREEEDEEERTWCDESRPSEMLHSPTSISKVSQWLNSKTGDLEPCRKSQIVCEHNFGKTNTEKSGPVPLSPESQQKKELCSYLQLRNMNSAEKKEVESVQNRRSVRVKNNLLLSERRNLEREDFEKSLCQKSFEELRVDVKRKSPDRVVSPVKVFDLVGIIRKDLLVRVGDFQDDMKVFLNREKALVRRRRIYWRNNSRKLVDLKLTPKPKRSKIRETINVLFGTPNNKKRKRKNSKVNIKAKNKIKEKVNRYEEILDDMPLIDRKILRKHNLEKYIAHVKSTSEAKKPKTLDGSELTIENIETIIGTKIQKSSEPSFLGFTTSEINESTVKHKKFAAYLAAYRKYQNSQPTQPKTNNQLNATITSDTLAETNFQATSTPKPETTPILPPKTIKISTLRSVLNAVLKSHATPQPNVPLTFKNIDNTSKANTPVVTVKILKIRSKQTPPIEKATILNGAQTKHITLPEDISFDCEKRNFVPLNSDAPVRSLHRSLGQLRKEAKAADLGDSEAGSPQSWDFCSNTSTPSKNHRQRQSSSNSHSIHLNPDNGKVVRVDYTDCNLVIAQELLVGVWTQSALGSILGAQDMWVPRGTVERLVLNNGCTSIDSRETVANVAESVAYVELWGKEHKSDKRESPVADVFASVYYWRRMQNGVHRKVLQLENISGFSHDVKYVVLKRSRNIVVSWYSVNEDTKQTLIHCYQMAADYQTVDTVRELQTVDHYVSSLHNILECDDIIMGCGENNVTIWNLEFGYVVATINISDVNSSPAVGDPDTLWVKCDRGFLFMLRRWSSNGKMCLIAINGNSRAWKRLQVYVPSNYYQRLKGVCVKDGILVAFYENGVVAWNVETGEVLGEEGPPEGAVCFPTGEHIVLVSDVNTVNVRDSLAYLITNYDM